MSRLPGFRVGTHVLSLLFVLAAAADAAFPSSHFFDFGSSPTPSGAGHTPTWVAASGGASPVVVALPPSAGSLGLSLTASYASSARVHFTNCFVFP